MNLTLITSNEKKLVELKRLGLPVCNRISIDIKEVLSDPLTVAIYKSIEAGKNTLIEDTVINVDGEDIVDIKWKIRNIKNNNISSEVRWIVTLAHNDGDRVSIYSGEKLCKINPKAMSPDFKQSKNSFGFDEYLIPLFSNIDGTPNTKNLYELECENTKDIFSARDLAVKSFISRSASKSFLIKDIPAWKGLFQND